MKAEYTDLGTMSYTAVWQKQTLLMERLKSEKAEGAEVVNRLLLVEHPHVYTIGRNGNMSNMLADAGRLKEEHVEFIKVDRGGDITYHGPGQLVVYPIFCLTGFRIGIKEYIRRLEEVVIRTLDRYGLEGERIDKAAGVWIAAGTPAARKICAIGVRCSQSVTMHGFALNVNTELDYFNLINPCGFSDRGVTSIQKEKGRKINISEIKSIILQSFKDIFDMEFTGNMY
jgi:lipoyl(octanoyl) transferase